MNALRVKMDSHLMLIHFIVKAVTQHLKDALNVQVLMNVVYADRITS
jgi:hypothetical protein